MLNKKAPPKFQIYHPIKGDIVDMHLAEYINMYGSPVPWTRDGAGNYTYGTKKVNVKYMRNNLIIKVGGGSMMVEEFIATYEDIELAKLNYQRPGTYTADTNTKHANWATMTRQQKMALARKEGSPRAGDAMNRMGSPKAASMIQKH